MNERKTSMVLSMVIFGSIGVFVRLIPMSSAAVACFRGICGALFILGYSLLRGISFDRGRLKKNMKILFVSGAAIGANWILLFEAYRYTSVAVATLCYYMQPVFVILLSPFITGEKLTAKRTVCVICSLAGMVLITGIASGSGIKASGIKGILLGLGAAMLYSAVIFLNKRLRDISDMEMTFFQLLYAGIAVMPYALVQRGFYAEGMGPLQWLVLLCLGIVHTGWAYTLYFGAMKTLSAQTTALFSYIDPVCAILFSAALLKEPLTAQVVLGALLILAPTMLTEMAPSKKTGKDLGSS